MKKKVIFIDWNRTLSYSLFWEHLKDSAHINSRHHTAIEKWLFVDNKDIIKPWMLGTESVDSIVAKMSTAIGVDKDLILNELIHSCENMVLCSADIEVLVRQLQDHGVLVVIATDNMDTFRKYTIPSLRLDELFDDILISSELGELKDDTLPADKIRFFDEYLMKKRLTYHDSVLLDDSPDSSGKYSKLGFERVLIDSPAKLVSTLEDMTTAYAS